MSGIILKVPIFVVLFALLNPSNASGQNWTLDDIDDWISELETAASLASSTGDNTCREILLAAGAGYRRVNGVSWNNELIRSRRWNGVYYPNSNRIEIDQNSDNVNRAVIHEGLYASRKYSVSEVHGMQPQIQSCANEYFRV